MLEMVAMALARRAACLQKLGLVDSSEEQGLAELSQCPALQWVGQQTSLQQLSQLVQISLLQLSQLVHGQAAGETNQSLIVGGSLVKAPWRFEDFGLRLSEILLQLQAHLLSGHSGQQESMLQRGPGGIWDEDALLWHSQKSHRANSVTSSTHN